MGSGGSIGQRLYPLFRVERDVLQMAGVLFDDSLGDWDDGSVDAEPAVRPKHAVALGPDRLHVVEVGFV
jgi:hypothetical protein